MDQPVGEGGDVSHQWPALCLPLAQVKDLLDGTRKYTHVAMMLEQGGPLSDTPAVCPAGSPAETSA
jgi:hypothetical protein